MAQTKKKRRRKHRGTQGGSIDRRGARARPKSRGEARSKAKSQYAQKRDQPPTWRGAITRGLVASGLFFVLIVFAFGRPAGAAAALSLVMLAFYIPMGYLIDRFFYNRRQAQRQRERQEAQRH